MFKKEDWFKTDTVNRYGEVKSTLVPRVGKIILTAVVGLLALIFIFGSFGTINAGERGIKTRFGAVVGVVDQGLYFKTPLIEHVRTMNIRTQTVSFDGTGGMLAGASKDLQDVQISTVVNYHIDPTKVDTIFAQYTSTESYRSNVVEPIIRDTVKSIASLYTAEELVTKRTEYNDKVTSTLSGRLAPKYVFVERVNITNFEFSKSFNAAIEAKVTAQQNAEAARNKLEQVKFEAQQTIESAKARAEAQRIESASLAAQGGQDYVSLKAIEKWDGKLPTQFVPGSAVPFLNLK